MVRSDGCMWVSSPAGERLYRELSHAALSAHNSPAVQQFGRLPPVDTAVLHDYRVKSKEMQLEIAKATSLGNASAPFASSSTNVSSTKKVTKELKQDATAGAAVSRAHRGAATTGDRQPVKSSTNSPPVDTNNWLDQKQQAADTTTANNNLPPASTSRAFVSATHSQFDRVHTPSSATAQREAATVAWKVNDKAEVQLKDTYQLSDIMFTNTYGSFDVILQNGLVVIGVQPAQMRPLKPTETKASSSITASAASATATKSSS